MKTICYSLLVGVLILLASCGNGKSSKFIAQAEKDNPIESNNVLGKWSALERQEDEALNLMTQSFNERARMISSIDEGLKLNSESNAEEDKIKKYFTSEIKKAADEVNGKEIPTTYDPAVFSSAKCVIEKTDSTHLSGNVELVLNTDLPKLFANVSFTFKKRGKIKDLECTEFLEHGIAYTKGKKVKFTISLDGGSTEDLKEIYFHS